MANYTYQCNECNHSFVVDHPMSEDPKIQCEKCESETRRVITGGMGFISSSQNESQKSYYTDKKHKQAVESQCAGANSGGRCAGGSCPMQ